MQGKLFIITNRKLIRYGNLCNIAKACAKYGADAIIIREKDLEDEQLYRLTMEVKKAVKSSIKVIVNGNYQVSGRSKADGIHFTYNDLLSFHKEYKGIKGVSIHSLEEAEIVNKMHINYALAGHIYNTECKKGLEGRGISFLNKICSAVKAPVIAIGGINSENAPEVMKNGASGIAVMSSIMEAEHPEKILFNLKESLII